jgi:hypothetical protein
MSEEEFGSGRGEMDVARPTDAFGPALTDAELMEIASGESSKPWPDVELVCDVLNLKFNPDNFPKWNFADYCAKSDEYFEKRYGARFKALTEPHTIYFIGAVDGDIKIGITKDFPSRFRSLGTGTSQPLKVWLLIPGSPSDERNLHKRFAADRLRGEWFRRSQAILNFISAHRCGAAS